MISHDLTEADSKARVDICILINASHYIWPIQSLLMEKKKNKKQCRQYLSKGQQAKAQPKWTAIQGKF